MTTAQVTFEVDDVAVDGDAVLEGSDAEGNRFPCRRERVVIIVRMGSTMGRNLTQCYHDRISFLDAMGVPMVGESGGEHTGCFWDSTRLQPK